MGGLNLARALRAAEARAIAFVGAGGKTSAMFQLARELKPPVIVTATSHLAAEQASLADRHLPITGPPNERELNTTENSVTLVSGQILEEKIQPIDSSSLKWLREYCEGHSVPLLIEADGSRGCPLKAPAEHEPPIPSFVDAVVVIAGLTALERRLDANVVHRQELFTRLSGLEHQSVIEADSVTQVLLHPDGGLKNIPPAARRVALLNQADDSHAQSVAGGMARELLTAYDAVVVCSLRSKQVWSMHENVAGIVLAGGASERFGRPKQLLDWRGQPFVRAVAQTALSAGLWPVLVITGSQANQVEAAVHDLPVEIARNLEWSEGQASSIRAGVSGLAALPLSEKSRHPGAAIFLLVDQPQVTPSILNALVEKHAAGSAPIIAPMVLDRRANPVLFDRDTFADLLTLKGDVGGRGIFSKHRVEYLPWHDERLLLDVDTPEQYARLTADPST